jgi:hypothetical protein
MTALGFIPLAHMLSSLAAGILICRVLVGRIVVSTALNSCGHWQANNITGSNSPAYQSSEMLTWQSLAFNNIYNVDNYVRDCYPLGVSRGALDYGKFITRYLPYQTDHDVQFHMMKSCVSVDQTERSLWIAAS